MPALNPQFLAWIGLLVLAALYAPVLFFAFQRSEGQEALGGLIAAFILVSMGVTIIEAFWFGGRLPAVGNGFVQGLELYAALSLAFLVMLILHAFMRRAAWWGWAVLAVVWIAGLAAIHLNMARFPDVIWASGQWELPRESLGAAWALVGWLIFMLGGVITVLREQRQTRQPLLRNRLSYWLVLYTLVMVNDLFIIGARALPGNPLRLGAALIIAYVALTHDLPDVRQLTRRGLVYLITTLLIVGIYVAGFLFSQTIFRAAPNNNPLLIGAIIALVLSLIFTPLLSAVRRMVDHWLKADQYDPGQTLHMYSQSISNILEMDRLASMAVGIILETMQVERGFLFLVDGETTAEGTMLYRLRLARSQAERPMVGPQMEESGALAAYFLREQRPLLQYDLDLLPAYRSVPQPEREWFRRLEVEVYVPIFAKRKWIGLLAFGSKISGNRYTDEDLVTLSALSNQTAVALENARLVDNLMRLNTDLRQARRALEKSNRDLERLDQTKSDFISIASHELRTPLTVIKGYTEMLMEDTNLDRNYQPIIKGIHDGALRLHQIMDSMFDIAQIDARTMEFNLLLIDLAEMLREECSEQRKLLQERQQSLTIELPVLPYIKVDPKGIRKVIQHLVNNAIKFTPNHGQINITARPVSPNGGDLPNGGVEIIFSDTGVGVDPNMREIIFTKFYQPGQLTKHSTSKSRFKGGGSGLGLALSKGIIEAHGGRIWVESPGYDEVNFPGSQFHLIVPLTKREESSTIPMSKVMSVKIE
ncbi:MAG: ATP-binding protein [Chloroflexota bacterium]